MEREKKMKSFLVLFAIIGCSFVFPSVHAQCTTATLPDGTQYDLSSLSTRLVYSYQTPPLSYQYLLYFCSSGVGGPTACYNPSSACQYIISPPPTTSYTLTQSNSNCASWTYQNGRDASGGIVCTMPANGDATYCNGKNRQSRFVITCGPTNTINSVADDASSCVYTFSITSPGACTPSNGGGSGGNPIPPSHSKSGLSGGSIFLIIFFVGLTLYCIVGAGLNYHKHQAKGIDLIPNKSFWFELPPLVKEGCHFTFQKIKELTGKVTNRGSETSALI